MPRPFLTLHVTQIWVTTYLKFFAAGLGETSQLLRRLTIGNKEKLQKGKRRNWKKSGTPIRYLLMLMLDRPKSWIISRQVCIS